METFIKDSGRMAWQMDKEPFVIPREVCMKDFGRRTSSMERALSIGTITRSSIKVTLLTERKLVWVSSHVRVASIKESFSMACSMEMDSIISQTPVKYIKDNLRKTNQVVWVK